MPDNNPLLIDCLEASHWNRDRFVEIREGGVSCVHITLAIWENARETLTKIGHWNRLLEANADLVGLATSAEAIEEIAASGRTAILFGFQNTDPLDDDIDMVQIYHTLGVRIIQLTYNTQNSVASGCWEEDDLGISRFFGRNVIKEMNKVGMLIDVSHCNEKTCFDAVELSERPVAITHGNPQEFVGYDIELNRRNRSTDLIKVLTEKGGVIGLGMYPKIMRGGSNSTREDFTEMVVWCVERFGVDCVGFGTDFNKGHREEMVTWWRAGRWARESPLKAPSKLSPWPEWFKTPAQFPDVLDALRGKGFSEEEMAKICGGNWLRLFRESFDPR